MHTTREREPRESLSRVMARTEERRKDEFCKLVESRMRGILDFPPDESVKNKLESPSDLLPELTRAECIEAALMDLATGPEGHIHWINNLTSDDVFLNWWIIKERNVPEENARKIIAIAINLASPARHQLRTGRDMNPDTMAQMIRTFEGAGVLLLQERAKNTPRMMRRSDEMFVAG
jgi:hypothetical protein